MLEKRKSILSSKKRYLQVALNSTMDEAQRIISRLPISDRILVEAGTPLIKRYGEAGIRRIKQWYSQRVFGQALVGTGQAIPPASLAELFIGARFAKGLAEETPPQQTEGILPYVVADLKMMDRGATEVEIAWRAGASAAVALGSAPPESLDAFVEKCKSLGLDSMIDMMNVEYPLAVLRKLKEQPTVVILHRGVDETEFNKEKQIPLYEIQRIKGNYDVMISIAGGDTIREVQRAIFNDADIVVVWKSFYQSTQETATLAEQFLKEIK